MNCTPERKALGTLEFKLCQDDLLYAWCRYGANTSTQVEFFKKYDPENFQEDDPCSGHQTSCEYLMFLTDECGAFYNFCHHEEERKQIMRMWVKQFLRETIIQVGIASGKFVDEGKEISTGKCSKHLNKFIDQKDVDEINCTVTDAILFNSLPNLFHCDGKCNTNNGDDQEWKGGDYGYNYIDRSTGSLVNGGYEWDDGLIIGRTGIARCYWHLEIELDSLTDFTDLDKAKMGLCKTFKSLIQKCSIPIGKCLGTVEIREVVMAEFLTNIFWRNKDMMGIWQDKVGNPDYFGDFSYKDCKIFGGVVAAASSDSSDWMKIVFSIIMAYNFTLLYI